MRAQGVAGNLLPIVVRRWWIEWLIIRIMRREKWCNDLSSIVMDSSWASERLGIRLVVIYHPRENPISGLDVPSS